MPEVPVTREKCQGDDNFAWEDLSNGDTGEPVVIKGGRYLLALAGDATVNWSPDGATEFDLIDISGITDGEAKAIDLANGYISVTAGADATSVWLRFIRR